MRFGRKSNRPERRPTLSPESLLLEHLRRLQRLGENRLVLHLHLSRLRPYNRRRHHLRIAATAFEPLTAGQDSTLYQLSNGDFLLIAKGIDDGQIEDCVTRLRFLFGGDPLFDVKADGTEGEVVFSSRYALPRDHEVLVSVAEALAEVQIRAEAKSMAEKIVSGAQAEPEPTHPIDAPRLGAVEEAIAHADLSHLVQRQAICAVAKDTPPRPLLHELYVSIRGLRHALLPSHDFEANQWLFRDLTRHLDQRMIAMLRHRDASSLRNSLSLNLNIATLLSPEFTELDTAIASAGNKRIVIELQLVDVFADLAGFAFARDYVHERGYHVCLDGATHLSLPFIDRKKLGVDLIKLNWSGDMADRASGPHNAALRDAVRRLEPGRIILSRCDEADAVEVGRSLGIPLFQGYHLDRLLAREPREGQGAESLAMALRRDREAARRYR